MTDEERFSIWWSDVGQRVRVFDARSWCLAGWLGHKIHGGEAPIEENTLNSPVCGSCDGPTDIEGWCAKCGLRTILSTNPFRFSTTKEEPKQIEET